MTKAQFNSEFGAEWLKFSRKPIFEALLSLIDDESPARNLQARPDGDRIHGAPAILNEIYGHERMRSLLVTLGNPEPSDIEVPNKFDEPERI